MGKIIFETGVSSDDNILNRDEIIGLTEMVHDYYSVFLKNERDIIVWLPPSYNFSDKYYPAIYMQDGQNLFNPNTSFIGYDWKVDEVCTKLMNEKIIEEFIVIGIYNTKDRLDEYDYSTPKGKKYSSFIMRELKPYIDENFRTKSGADNCAVAGSSMGGLISFQLAWNFPHVFGLAACLSNSFWASDHYVFDMISNETTASKISKLYIDCGDQEKELLPDFYRMCKTLKKKKFTNKNLLCHLEKNARHSEYDWARRLNKPLKFLFER